MYYYDGEKVYLRDIVHLSRDMKGKVVAINEEHKFINSDVKHAFGYISNGVTFDTNYGYMHYDSLNEDIELIKRGRDVDKILLVLIIIVSILFSFLYRKA